MQFVYLFFAELFLLFFVSRLMIKRLSKFVYLLTRNHKTTVYIMALLFFPGTVIHELSHLLMAGILFVPVGHLELWPKIEQDHVKLGSVAIGETDIFRRFLVGAAPFVFGTALLLGFIFFIIQNGLLPNILFILAILYISFEIGNTMFSSQKDMEGALEFLATVAFLTITIYFLNIKLPIPNIISSFQQPMLLQVFQQGVIFLSIPLAIDIFILVLLRIPLRKRL